MSHSYDVIKPLSK